MMKKLLALLLTIVMLLSLAACNSDKDSDDNQNSSDSYNTAINNYQAVLNGNTEKLTSLAPNEIWEWAEENGNVAQTDVKRAYKDQYEDLKEDLEEEFGKNATIKITETDKKEMSKRDIHEIGEMLEASYDIDEGKITAGWEMEVEIAYKGKDDNMEVETELHVVKISNQWYVVEGIEALSQIITECWNG